MIKYIITSETFRGEATLTYDENGERFSFECFNTDMRMNQHEWLMNWICENAATHNDLTEMLIMNYPARLKFQQITFEPTFAEFWAAYFKSRYKDNSSKKKSEAKWNKMSKGEQLAAYNYISRYFSQIATGMQHKLAETYLNSEVWVK